MKEKGLALVFLDSRLEHPAGWICARYKSSVLLLLLLLDFTFENIHRVQAVIEEKCPFV